MQILPLYNGINVLLFPVQGQGREFGNSKPRFGSSIAYRRKVMRQRAVIVYEIVYANISSKKFLEVNPQ
jgi:hypothetical protein